MIKTLLCLFLSGVFAFMGLSAYESSDALPMKQWLAYYSAYQTMKSTGTLDDKNKLVLLNRLCLLYPDRAAIYKAEFKVQFGDLEKQQEEKAAKEEAAAAKEKEDAAIAERRREQLSEAKNRLEQEIQEKKQEIQKRQTQKQTTTTPKASDTSTSTR